MSKRAEYDAFINSDVWRAIRKRALQFYGKRCQACQVAGSGLHVHHATYTRFGGDERLTDLRILCQACHSAVHDLHKSNGGSLRATTDAFIGGRTQRPAPRTKRKRKRRKDRETPAVPAPAAPQTGKRPCGCIGQPGQWKRQCKAHNPLPAPKKNGLQPCGCIRNPGNWRRLCEEHAAARAAVPAPQTAPSVNAPGPGRGMEARLMHRPTPNYLNGGVPARPG